MTLYRELYLNDRATIEDLHSIPPLLSQTHIHLATILLNDKVAGPGYSH